jgi:ubiquinone/menaquinone biosynthesis C-methylase UbiE
VLFIDVNMPNNNLFQKEYWKSYDAILLEIPQYIQLRDMHVKAFERCVTIVDSGAGTGNAAVELIKYGKNVTLVDSNQKALEIAMQKTAGACPDAILNLSFFCADASDTGLARNFYHGINSMLVLPFVEDADTYLAEQNRLLVPGGKLALSGVSHIDDVREVLAGWKGELEKKGKFEELKEQFHIFALMIRHNVDAITRTQLSLGEAVAKIEQHGFAVKQAVPNPLYYDNGYFIEAEKK